jgi:hypothetical protein
MAAAQVLCPATTLLAPALSAAPFLLRAATALLAPPAQVVERALDLLLIGPIGATDQV